MDEAQHMLPPLLLKNGGNETNMCSLNSNLQLLRHIPELMVDLTNRQNDSALMNTLHSILNTCGNFQSSSALLLREILANVTGKNLNSGEQHDTIELLGYLLDKCKIQLFHFETSFEYRFWIDNHVSPCPTCRQNPDKVPGFDKILRLALPPGSATVSLNDLLNHHFSIKMQWDGRSCGNCNSTVSSPKHPYKEKLNITEYPDYMLIQLVRMKRVDGRTIKIPLAVTLPDIVNIDKFQYSVIGTISHMGTADAGHNRAYLRQGSRWFLCEDYKLPTEKQPIDSTVEQNYCLLLKRCAIKDCSVVITQLPREFVKKTYANVIREPRRFLPKASSMENISKSREKPDLKRAFSSSMP